MDSVGASIAVLMPEPAVVMPSHAANAASRVPD
jgi:hypothetical protein